MSQEETQCEKGREYPVHVCGHPTVCRRPVELEGPLKRSMQKSVAPWLVLWQFHVILWSTTGGGSGRIAKFG